MPEITDEETPIFTKLMQEYSAKQKFAEIFGPEVQVTPLDDAGEPSGETFKVRGGSVTVYGNPVAPRDA